MPLGMEVGFGPGHIVLDVGPAPLHQKGGTAPNFRSMSIVAKQLDGSRWSIVQGSGIGPTLFIMFAHNLKPLDMSNYLLKYDDDATLLSPQNSPTPVQGLTSQVIYYRPHSQTLIECAMQSCSESTLDMILISPSMSSPLLLFVTKYFTCLHNLKNRALVYVP